MSYEHLYGLEPQQTVGSYFDNFKSRDEILHEVKERPRYDVVVVGGGIHGATFARLAAFNGLKTLLLEMHDFASGTSSRSSKMAHGGLRYLEMLDFQQVFEGIKAREELFEVAPHLATPYDFLIPITSRWERWKFEVGLSLYDLFLPSKERRHSWIPRSRLATSPFSHRKDLEGCFRYCDGLMDDMRLVIETIVSARQEGAHCLNYARVDSVKHRNDDIVEVGFTDILKNEKHEVATGIVVNCAGPWAPLIGRLTPPSPPTVVYSRGVHLLFNTPWKAEALFLPMELKGRYYFVWPHFSGTMVGTTEREVKPPLEIDPQPTREEVDEILSRLARDLPHSQLNRQTLHYAFAGVRTLPLRKGKKGTSSLSRKHIWSFGQGMLTLLGGKYTTAAWTSFEGLSKVWKLARLPGAPTPLQKRRLPGGISYDQSRFRSEAKKAGVPDHIAEETIRRLGARTMYLLEKPDYLEVVGDVVCKGELLIAVHVEQAETLEDVLRRRLQLEFLPGNGVNALEGLASALSELIPPERLDVEEYRRRVVKVRETLNGS